MQPGMQARRGRCGRGKKAVVILSRLMMVEGWIGAQQPVAWVYEGDVVNCAFLLAALLVFTLWNRLTRPQAPPPPPAEPQQPAKQE